MRLSVRVSRLTTSLVALAILVLSFGVLAAPAAAQDTPQELLISEYVVTPTAGEYIEIYNPNDTAVDLSNVYLTDATFPGNDNNPPAYYYELVLGDGSGGGGGFGDFNARFPDGATIAPGEYQTVALAGSDDFFATYAENPTYELYEDGEAADTIPDMREAVEGSINNQGGLTNGDEVVILYFWDGASDLVTDLDYVVYGDKDEAVDKTGVSIDGPDDGDETSTYNADTAIADQASGPVPGGGESAARVDLSEGAEATSGGNGINGEDETSEDTNNTFCVDTPTPNDATSCAPRTVINEFDAETDQIELFNAGQLTQDLEGWYLTDSGVCAIETGEDATLVFGAGSFIEPGAYLVLDQAADSTEFSFNLGGGGDLVSLCNAADEAVDVVGYGGDGAAPSGVDGDIGVSSVARIKDGVDTDDDARDFNVDLTPTFGAANDPVGVDLGSGLVVNEIDTNNEIVEIYNPTENEIDATGYLLRDAGGGLFTFPANALIPSGATYVVVLEDEEQGIDFFGLNDSDNLYLHLPDTTRIDQIGMGADPEFDTVDGQCFSRNPDGAGPNDGWNYLTSGGDATFFVQECSYGLPGVPNTLINEFDAETDQIELFNAGNAAQNLEGWYLTDSGVCAIEPDVTVVFPPATELAEGAYLVLDNAAEAAEFGFNLGGGGDFILLCDNNNTPVDAVGYGDSGGAPTGVDAEISASSIARINDGVDTDKDAQDFNVDLTPTFGAANDPIGNALGSGLVINEVDTNAESVELFNPTENEIDASGYLLRDAGGGLYAVPDNTLIPAGGFFVAVTEDENNDFFGISDTDNLYLHLPDTTRIDQIGMNNNPEIETADGQCFARVPDAAGPNTGWDYLTSGGDNTFVVQDCTLSSTNFPVVTAASELLITEYVVTPTAGEFVEIYNPGDDVIDLSNVYLTDATFAGNDNDPPAYYYELVLGDGSGGGGGFGDFNARFPDGATIAPGEFQTVALAGSDDFFATYGQNPTYELYEDGEAADTIPDMREAVEGSINNQGGLTNGDEVVILYFWDGASDLVTDLDYVVYGDKDEAVDKTGVSIDGPDADAETSTYNADTAIADQASGPVPGGGQAASRVDLTEGAEISSGGNGINGEDETSEDTNNTFEIDVPTPNQPGTNTILPGPRTVINEFDNETEQIELYNAGDETQFLDGWYVTNSVAGCVVEPETVLLGAGTQLEAGGYLVLDQGEGSTELGFNLGNSGDVLLLCDANDVAVDRVGYGGDGGAPSSNDPDVGVSSVARIKDGVDTDNDAQDFNVDLTPTFGAANDPASTDFGSGLVINEIDTNTESVELYNPTADAIDATGYLLRDAGGGLYAVPANTTIPAGGYFVAVTESETLDAFGINDADTLYLHRPDTTRIDQIGMGTEPEFNTADGECFARVPDGAGPNTGFNYPTSGGDETFVVQACTLGNVNVPPSRTVFEDELLVTEFAVTPTAGEFIEIYNPGAEAVDLSNVYLTDATFAGNDNDPPAYYYELVLGDGSGGGGGFGDFNARFPDGASIAAGEYQTIALNGSTNFFATYGVEPTYELYEDAEAADAILDMREATEGSINNQGGLTNDDEIIILYAWDGTSDLVVDLDYVQYGGSNENVDKTGVVIDSAFDDDEVGSAYAPDTPLDQQANAPSHGSDETVSRNDLTEGTEVSNDGNGVGGDDETSEDTNLTFCVTEPTPGTAFVECAEAPPTEFFIHEIQGTEDDLAFAGNVIVTGIVTADFQDGDQLDGFFMQEEDADADADPATSEGIFVFCGSCNVAVNVGDQVRVAGSSNDRFGQTQITATGSNDVEVLSTDNTLPTVSTPIIPTPPEFASRDEYLERFEGMRVTFPNTFIITGNSQGTFGELVLTSNDDRLYAPTNRFRLDEVAELNALIDANDRSKIILDDDRDGAPGFPVYAPTGDDDVIDLVPDVGSTLAGVEGIMGYGFSEFRVRPVDVQQLTEELTYGPDLSDTLVDPVPVIAGDISIASYNVENYFNGPDRGDNSPEDPRGPFGNQEAEDQEDKLIAAIVATLPDVVGLIEIENDAGTESALADFTAALNQAIDPENATYDYIATGVIAPAEASPDAIKVAVIYKPSVVTPEETFEIINNADDPNYFDDLNRPALAQTFTVTDEANASNGASFTVIVNHLKSKGSSPDVCNYPSDGPAGSCNNRRTDAANAIINTINSGAYFDGKDNIFIIGDLNSYAQEDPILALEAGGFIDFAKEYIGPEAYSFVFGGEAGTLDYIMGNNPAVIADFDIWHIATDESSAYNYESARDFGVFDPNDPRGASDHDMVLVGFSANPPANESTVERIDAYGLTDTRALVEFTIPEGVTPDEVLISIDGTVEETITDGSTSLFIDDLACGTTYTFGVELVVENIIGPEVTTQEATFPCANDLPLLPQGTTEEDSAAILKDGGSQETGQFTAFTPLEGDANSRLIFTTAATDNIRFATANNAITLTLPTGTTVGISTGPIDVYVNGTLLEQVNLADDGALDLLGTYEISNQQNTLPDGTNYVVVISRVPASTESQLNVVGLSSVTTQDFGALENGIFEDNNVNIATTGDFFPLPNDDARSGAFVYGDLANELSFTITGTQFAVEALGTDGLGTLQICVDGATGDGCQTLDLDTDALEITPVITVITGLADGEHDVVLSGVPGSADSLQFITFDAVIVGEDAPTPANFTATAAGRNSIDVAFDAITNNTVESVEILLNGEVALTLPQGTNSGTISDAFCGTAYDVTAQAVSIFGTSTPTDAITVTTDACPNPIPAGTTVENGSDSFNFVTNSDDAATDQWFLFEAPSASGGNLTYTVFDDAFVEFQTEGSGFIVQTVLADEFGEVTVEVEGGPTQTFSLDNDGDLAFGATVAITGLNPADAPHTVRISLNGAGIFALDKVTATGPLTAGTIIEDGNINLVYSDGWFTFDAAGSEIDASGDSLAFTTDPNATVQFTYTGTTARIRYYQFPDGGQVNAILDGDAENPLIIDQDGDPAAFQTFDITADAPGEHTVVLSLEPNTGLFFTLDSVEIDPAGLPEARE